jgi:signal transduction histidine kinase
MYIYIHTYIYVLIYVYRYMLDVNESSGLVIYGKLVITVTDTGAGLSKTNQAKLFHQIVQFNPEVLQVYMYI